MHIRSKSKMYCQEVTCFQKSFSEDAFFCCQTKKSNWKLLLNFYSEQHVFTLIIFVSSVVFKRFSEKDYMWIDIGSWYYQINWVQMFGLRIWICKLNLFEKDWRYRFVREDLFIMICLRLEFIDTLSWF